MQYDPDKHHRRSIRLKGYDYSQAGAYFITICSFQRACILGQVEAGQMKLSEIGAAIQRVWENLPNHYTHLLVDAFVIMPNHIHGLLVLGANPSNAKRHDIPMIVGSFKSFSAREAHQIEQNIQVWQRNYYEHIVREDDELNAIRQYIVSNPLQWDKDIDNPASTNFRND